MKDYFKIAIRNLKARRLRSYLTTLGILIGVFLICSLLSLSEGLKESIISELRTLGKEVLMIFPGEITDLSSLFTAFFGRGLKIEDETIEKIKKIEGVENVVPLDYGASLVRYKEKTKTVLLFGYPRKEAQELFKMNLGWKLDQGRWPKPKKREVIVGKLVPSDIFPGLKPGDKIYIKGREFLVTGVLKSLGTKQDDSMIGLDIEDYRKITGFRKGSHFALVKIKSGVDTERMAQKIKEVLKETQKRKAGKEEIPFTILTNEKAGSIAGNILALIQIIVFAFASVAIIVGGIGIMNTMFTSVRERTREIGILKAVGAKNSEILIIFLIESAIMGIIGGILGTFLGIFFAKFVEFYGQVHPLLYFKASITPNLILFGFFFSLFVGIISGYWPAKRAAALKPADALRYFE